MINNNTHIINSSDFFIDLSMVYDVSGNDENFIKIMVQTFLKTMPGTIKRMEQSLIKKDWVELYQAAHFSKSSLSVIKIDEMLDWIKQVEVIVKNSPDVNMLQGLVGKIKNRYILAEALLKENYEKDPE